MEFNDTITTPGFVDIHVHLREPSENKSESIYEGTLAAKMGGFVLLCDMPNNPGNPTWSEEKLDEKIAIAKRDTQIPISFNSGSQPESDNIGELEGMSKKSLLLKLYGAPTTGNDNDYEADEFREIVEEWHRVAPDKPIGLHAGENNLEDMIGLVAQDYDHPLHIHHVHNTDEVGAVIKAKNRGFPVTNGVTPHHLVKTSHDVRSEGWAARMIPPLADQDMAEKLMMCLDNGSIDIIETDHAPHSPHNKLAAEEENADGIHIPGETTCFGVPGIDVAAPLLFYQAHRGYLQMERLVDAMSYKPAEIIGVDVSNTEVEWDMTTLRRVGSETRDGQISPYLGKYLLGEPKSITTSVVKFNHPKTIIGKDQRTTTDRGTVI